MIRVTQERLNAVVAEIVTHVRRIMRCESGIIPLHVPVIGGKAAQYVNDAEDGSEQTIFAEVVGVLKPGVDDDVLHDIVQLYR